MLLIMALLHGSGFAFVVGAMNESNARDFLKDIFPVLFAHPSIQLGGLAVLGLVCSRRLIAMRPALMVVAVLVAIDAGLAFLLSALVPGLLLTAAAACFLAAFVMTGSAASGE